MGPDGHPIVARKRMLQGKRQEKGSLFPNNGRVGLPMRSKMGIGTVPQLRTRTFQQLFTFSFIRMPPFLRRSYVH